MHLLAWQKKGGGGGTQQERRRDSSRPGETAAQLGTHVQKVLVTRLATDAEAVTGECTMEDGRGVDERIWYLVQGHLGGNGREGE